MVLLVPSFTHLINVKLVDRRVNLDVIILILNVNGWLIVGTLCVRKLLILLHDCFKKYLTINWDGSLIIIQNFKAISWAIKILKD